MRKCFLLLACLICFLCVPKTIHASPLVGDCETQAECEAMAPGAICNDGKCIQYGSSLKEFQQKLDTCTNTGIIASECWIANTPELITPEGNQGQSGVIHSILSGLLTALIGPITTTKAGAYVPGGAIKSMASLITSLSSPPVSTNEYFAYLGRKLNLVSPVYAQGFGYEALNSLLNLWNAFKNISYVFFIIVFVITGFAIMFRAKIDPQTVINMQNALPRIVIGLILVTFSYAIAGLFVDLIYVIFFLMVNAVQAFGGITATEGAAMTYNYSTSSLFGTLASLGKIGYNNLRELLVSIIPFKLGNLIIKLP